MKSFRLPAMDHAVKEESRKYRAKMRARDRRQRQMDLLQELSSSLPLEQSELDYSTLLRLTVAYFKTKQIVQPAGCGDHGNSGDHDNSGDEAWTLPNSHISSDRCGEVVFPPNELGESSSSCSEAGTMQVMRRGPRTKEGTLQQLMIQALDGFLAVFSDDGTILFASKTVNQFLGLTQTECMSQSLFDLVVEEDHKALEEELENYRDLARDKRDSVHCSFFCRMKCLSSKGRLGFFKSDGHKLMYVNGMYKCGQDEALIVAMVAPVSPPPIRGIRMEGNMFKTQYRMDMRCTFYDGRLTNLLGYGKDFQGRLIFDLHHHDDILMCQKSCANLLTQGETVSGYYRMLTKWLGYVWCQTRAQLKCDETTGEPNRIECMNFIISVDEGERSLRQRSLTSSMSSEGDMFSAGAPSPSDSMSSVSLSGTSDAMLTERVHDPIPIIHETRRNPFSDDDNSSMADTHQLSPVSSFVSHSPEASLSSSNSPGLLSSVASVGLLSPTNSLGHQSAAYSPGRQSATNSPGIQSAAYSPGHQSAAYSPGLQSATNSPATYSPQTLSANNSPGLQSAAYSPGLQSATNSPATYSPQTLSASNSPGLQSAAYSPGLQSATNSPATYNPQTLSASNSPGLQSATYSPRCQSATYSPAMLSSANSPEQLSTANSPGLLSTANISVPPSANGATPHQHNGFHGSNGVGYWDFPPHEPGVGSTANRAHCWPINNGPGLLTSGNRQQLPIHTAVASQVIYPSVSISASNHVAMVPAPPSMRRGIPSSIPSSVNGANDAHFDADFNQFLSELDSIPFRA